jgi:hypothetical protein
LYWRLYQSQRQFFRTLEESNEKVGSQSETAESLASPLREPA